MATISPLWVLVWVDIPHFLNLSRKIFTQDSAVAVLFSIDISNRSLQNAELFTLTCGAIVRQLLTDLEEVDEANKQLDQM